MHRSISYSTAKIADCFDHEGKKILGFTIRTTDGSDEAYASKQAEARGTAMTEELIRSALVEYRRENDGKEEKITISQPFTGFDKWSTKARNFVVLAWKRISSPSDAEAADFFASASESA